MSDYYADLKAKAEAATPGPWRIGTPCARCKLPHSPHGRGECRYTFNGWSDDSNAISRAVKYGPDDVVVDDGLIAGMWDHDQGGIVHSADAAYIAAAHPQAVLALIARVAVLEAALRRAQEDFTTCEEAGEYIDNIEAVLAEQPREDA